jgi:tetratricopeptide (TPR) repeat protein
VLPVAQECGDEELLSIPAGALGQTMAVLGHLSESAGMLTKAAGIFERLANWTEWIQAKSFLGTAVASMGSYREGLQHIEDAYNKAEELNFLAGVAMSHNCFGYAYLFGGELEKSVQSAQTAIEVARQSGDRIYVYVGFGISAWAACRKGDLANAAQYLAQCRAIADELGGRVIMGDLFITAAAETALNAGQPDKAIELAQQAVEIAQQIKGILAEGIARRVWAQALCAKDAGNWDEAQDLLTHSLKILQAGQNNNEVARTRLIWGRLCADTGRTEAAHDHWQDAARAFDAAGMIDEAASVKRLLEN